MYEPAMFTSGAQQQQQLEDVKSASMFGIAPSNEHNDIKKSMFHIGGSPQESIDDDVPAKFRVVRTAIEWRLLGVFDTEEAMNSVRCKEKVSKRKTDRLRSGIKVTYRCNKWKRTRCPFQMYAMYQAIDAKIALYESGYHDHESTIIRRRKTPSAHSSSTFVPSLHHHYDESANSGHRHPLVGHHHSLDLPPPTCSSSSPSYNVYGAPSMVQQQSTAMLNSLLQQAIKKDYSSTSALSMMSQSPAEVINVVVGNNQCSSSSNSYFPAIKTERSETPASETSSSPTQSTNCHTESMRNSSTFVLSDGQSIAQLLQIAAEMDLTFTFNSRRSGEYCFASSNSRTTGGNDNNGKMVVFADLGHELRISERFGPEEIDVEIWTKADWQQFLWAVRGKCQKVLKS